MGGTLRLEESGLVERVKSISPTFSSGLNTSPTMLSRLATKALCPIGRSSIHTTGIAATKPAGKPDDYFDPWENPERDYVNFPTARQQLYCSPTRHVIFPEHWFKAFYPKTGVTGPYAFAFGLATFALSKEYYIIEHETFAGIEWAAAIAIILKYVIRPYVVPMLDKEIVDDEARLKAIRQNEIDKYKGAIEAESEAQFQASSYEELIAAKKDAVALQLEAEYRARLAAAYTQVKQRLDYQLELGNVMRRVEQKHMVDWIISNVRKSITAKQEDEALKTCVAELKALAPK